MREMCLLKISLLNFCWIQTLILGILWRMDCKFKSRLGTTNETRIKLIKALYTSTVEGHSGQKGCLHKVNTLFHQPHMKNDVLQFVRTCDLCQRRKSENMPYPSLLQPIPVPTQAWSHLTIDFIEQLPLSRGLIADQWWRNIDKIQSFHCSHSSFYYQTSGSVVH